MNARVLAGDCRELLPTLDAESVDAVVTDPPYGLGFMGVKWDTYGDGKGRAPSGKVSFDQVGGNSHARKPGGQELIRKKENQRYEAVALGWFTAALRVAKPGAHLVAFGGTRTFHRLTCAIEDAGWEIRDCLAWLYGSGFPKSLNIGGGRGTALKPAYEPIILARKPLCGTVAANVEKHGTGALNIEGCRIGTDSTIRECGAGTGDVSQWRTGKRASVNGSESGRWPANVVLDEGAAELLDMQSGELAPGNHPATRRGIGFTENGGGANTGTDGERRSTESGGASRFFYTAKASRSERDAGLENADRPITVTPRYGDGIGQGPNKTAQRNHHPTVKPLDLMQWLVRLVTPKGGLVLDPFCGSGTTGRAAVAEGFRFIGIELEEEYAAIARARIADYAPLFLEGGA